MSRRGLLLVNLGTPDSPSTGDVRRYLREFLSDPLVIDIPAPARLALLYGVILPFRPRRSAEAYRLIWTERGSPLLFHTEDLTEKVRGLLGEGIAVEFAMRYQNPSIGAALDRLRAAGVTDLAVLPLFPQYSEAATRSAIERVRDEAAKRAPGMRLRVVPPFYEDPGFLAAFAEVGRPVLDELEPDRVLFSYHGVPERHCRKTDRSETGHCFASPDCCAAIVDANRDCYRAQCFATTHGLVRELGLGSQDYEVAFQSRLGRTPWIRPYTDERVRELAQQGVRRLAVFSPSFVADCLETLEEIAIRARADFVAHGGEHLELVPSLNSSDTWARVVAELARSIHDDSRA